MHDNCCNSSDMVFETDPDQLETEKKLALQAKALSHPARLRILHTLYTLDTQGGCFNGDLVSQLDLAQSTVSEHLRILKQAGFIWAEPNPPKVCYHIKSDALQNFSMDMLALFS